MSEPRVVAATALFLILTACSSPENGSVAAGTWVGTITTEGNVTTVVNESGSVWGGPATLVEELSIGVESGAEEYMFGEITVVFGTNDAVYVLDAGSSLVRVFDLEGRHVRSFGGAGQGPGELSEMAAGLAVTTDGTVYVGDARNRRVNIYGFDGVSAGEIPVPNRAGFGRAPLVFAEGGGVWMQERVTGDDPAAPRYGYRAHTPEGPVGDLRMVPEIDYERRTLRMSGRDIESVPFAAGDYWTLATDGSLLSGATDRYEIESRHPDGTTTVIRRQWDPVPVTADEADYWRRLTLASMSQFVGEPDWNGENIPDHKPAFIAMLSAASGELWLLRHGPSSPERCGLEPAEMAVTTDTDTMLQCMMGDMIIDAFDPAGRYLGEVRGFNSMLALPFVDGETVWAVVQDEAGTVTVKRYRLVLPEGG